MHQIVLLTALTATSGLFGGRAPASCPGGQCGAAYYPAPSAYSACAGGSCGYTYAAPVQPQYQYPAQPQYQYPAQPQYQYPAAVAPQAAQAPMFYSYNSYYYAPMSPCAGGTCPR
jgi:hypothetical protein